MESSDNLLAEFARGASDWKTYYAKALVWLRLETLRRDFNGPPVTLDDLENEWATTRLNPSKETE